LALQNGNDEELFHISSSPNVLRVGYAASRGEEKGIHGLVRKPERKGPLGRPRNRGKIILKWILKK